MMRPTRISASSRFYTNYPGGAFSPVEMIGYFHEVGFRAVDFDIETVPAMGDEWKRILTEMAEEAAKKENEVAAAKAAAEKVAAEKAALEQMYANIARQTELLEKLANK